MRTIEAPQSGQIVRVRQRQYLVEEVVPPRAGDDSTLVRLSCLDDDAQGQPLEVLWEQEVDAEILTGEAWEHIASRGFDQPKLFSAYLHTLRWNCVTATDPRLFQSPFRAGIRLDAYQLEPLRKALRLPRVNLFIADDVGLGKTIEAGLIARELLLRKKVRDIVVACPPSMLLQWQDELENRFGLAFEILDRDYVDPRPPRARLRRQPVEHALPLPRLAPPADRRGLRRRRCATGSGDFRRGTLAHPRRGPPRGAGQRREVRHRLANSPARSATSPARFEHRLFLSATPHNGHSNSFSALLEILDPQRFCRGVTGRPRSCCDDVMVRRLKDDLREVAGGFPKRKVVQIDIDGLPPTRRSSGSPRCSTSTGELREQRLKRRVEDASRPPRAC